eukprot:gene1891-1978_t
MLQRTRPSTRNENAVEDVQARSFQMLNKTFLHFLPQLLSLPTAEYMELWRGLLGVFYTHHTRPPVNQGESLVRDMIQQSVKNMIFVLTSMLSDAKHAAMLATHPTFWG